MEKQEPYGAARTVVPLSKAMLCMDCDAVFHLYGGGCRCPACGSAAVAAVSLWVRPMPAFEPRVVAA